MTLKTRNAIARALAKEDANVMINGMGVAAAMDAERAGMTGDPSPRCARMKKPRETLSASSHVVRRSTGTERRIIKPLGFQS